MRLLNSILFRGLRKQRYGYRCRTTHSKIKGSYCFKNGKVPLTNLTLGSALNQSADEYGNHVAYISHQQGLSKTYLELRNEAEKLASGLIACGLRRGDRVAVYCPNSYEWPLIQYATAKAGLIAVAINYASQPIEVEHCLKKTSCKAVISFDKMKYLDYYNVFKEIIPNLESRNPMKLQIEKLPNLETIIMVSEENKQGTIRLKDVMNMGDKQSDETLSKLEKVVENDDPVNIQFTSGTTGNPKAAILTHHGLLNVSNKILHRLEYDKQPPISCCQVPLFHAFGTVFSLCMPMMTKCTTILPSFSHDASESLKCIERYKCTTVIGTPTMFIDLLKTHPTLKSDISSLKQAIFGGSSMPDGCLKGLLHEFKIQNIHCGYGLTETCAGATINGYGVDYDTLLSGFMEPLDGQEMKIVDRHCLVVPQHMQGEIRIRGFQLFSGYWEDKEKTAEAVDEKGWFHTGDIGEMNDKGWIKIVGRLKDIVIRGGENIHVTEVENFLSNHPAISEVYVCGVPDERLGEELCCWISLKPGEKLNEEDIKAFCKGKLSYYKIPKYILFVEEFPKNTVGKIKKFEMTKISKERLNL